MTAPSRAILLWYSQNRGFSGWSLFARRDLKHGHQGGGNEAALERGRDRLAHVIPPLYCLRNPRRAGPITWRCQGRRHPRRNATVGAVRWLQPTNQRPSACQCQDCSISRLPAVTGLILVPPPAMPGLRC